MKNNTLFLIGLPRSGTSLLYRLVNNHSKISLIYESDIFYVWPRILALLKSRSWLARLDQWNGQLNRHVALNYLKDRHLHKKQAIEHLMPKGANHVKVHTKEIYKEKYNLPLTEEERAQLIKLQRDIEANIFSKDLKSHLKSAQI